jgi:hypothetical protein
MKRSKRSRYMAPRQNENHPKQMTEEEVKKDFQKKEDAEKRRPDFIRPDPDVALPVNLLFSCD